MLVAYSDTLTKNTRTLKHLGQLKQKMQKFETSVAGFDQGKGKPSVPGRTFSTYHAKTWPSLGSHHVHRWWICYAYAPLGAQCVGEEDLRLFLTQPAFTHTNLQFTRHMFATQSKTHTHMRVQEFIRIPKYAVRNQEWFSPFYNLGLICSLLAAFIHDFLHFISLHDQNPSTLSPSMLLLALGESLCQQICADGAQNTRKNEWENNNRYLYQLS